MWELLRLGAAGRIHPAASSAPVQRAEMELCAVVKSVLEGLGQEGPALLGAEWTLYQREAEPDSAVTPTS